MDLSNVDAHVRRYMRAIVKQQIAVYNQRRRFLAIPPTHKTVPTKAEMPDNLDARHPREAQGWQLQFEKMAFRLKVDEYQGPRGDGYFITVETKQQNQIWERSEVIGPDKYLGFSWREQPEDDLQ